VLGTDNIGILLLSDFDPFASRTWTVAHNQLISLGEKAVIMGILNVTPDSFSDGNLYKNIDDAVLQAVRMRKAGAGIIDIGGESTKPGSKPVSEKTEQKRIMPVIEALSEIPDMIISVDTYRYSTAKLAIGAGAHIINDVWGCQKEPEIADLVAETGAGLCAMHNGRQRKKDADVIQDQLNFLNKSLKTINKAGVEDNQIILDPGFGFGKSHEDNIELLHRFDELSVLGFPLLVGTSRKRFIGHYTDREVEYRDIGTAATSVVARMKGGSVFRVHDVSINKDALAIADASRIGRGTT